MWPPFSLFCAECVLVCLVMDIYFWVIWKGDQKGRIINLHGCGIFVRIDMMNRSLSIDIRRWRCIWLMHQGRLHSSLTVWLLIRMWLRWLYFVYIRCCWGKLGLGHQWLLRNTGDSLQLLCSGDTSWWQGRCFVVGNWFCGVGCFEILWRIFMWREFWTGWKLVVKLTEDCKDVSWHG